MILKELRNRIKRQRLYKVARKHYVISLFILCLLFVFTVVIWKTYFVKPLYVYAEVKVGQGYWWVGFNSPNTWIKRAARTGEKQYDILRKTKAEIVDARYYPTAGSQIDTFITLKLRVSYNRVTGLYSFERSPVSIGSPIEVQFPTGMITGSVTAISKTPFQRDYVEKKVELVYRGGYLKDFTSLYDGINVGDTYFDGKDKVLTVLDKRLQQNIWTISNNLNAQVYDREIDTTQNIIVDLNIKVQQIDGQLIYGGDQVVRVGNYLAFSTSRYTFNNFIVSKIY